MYCKYAKVKKALNSNSSKTFSVKKWIASSDKIIECIDNSEIYYDEIDPDESASDSERPFVRFSNMKLVIRDMIKTLRLLETKNISDHKCNKKLLLKIAKIIVADIFVGKIQLHEEHVTELLDFMIKSLRLPEIKNISHHKKDKKLLSEITKIIIADIFMGKIRLHKKHRLELLDFVDWNCELLLGYGEEWVSCEEDAGISIVKLLDLARKHNKQITEYTSDNVTYCLLMAVHHCQNKYAENFIIGKKIKLSKKMAKSEEAVVSDMIEYFDERGYNLIK